jgi:Ca2+-binding EF-hand superfamily protein
MRLLLQPAGYIPGASLARGPHPAAIGRKQVMRLLRAALLGTATLALALPALAQTAPGQGAGPAQAQRGPGPHGLAAVFDRADTNKDGKVTWDEAWNYVQQRFNAADTNHDGALSQEEMAAAWPGGRRRGNAEVPPERAAQHARMTGMMFRGLDANRDGRVTLDEIRPVAEARFRAFDANGDNVITRDELPQRPPHRGRPGQAGQAAPATPAAPAEGSGAATPR